MGDYSSSCRRTREPMVGRLQNIKICPLRGLFFVFRNTFKQVCILRNIDRDYSSSCRRTRDPMVGRLQNIKICPLRGLFLFSGTPSNKFGCSGKQKNRLAPDFNVLAEKGGFEPPVRLTTNNGFRDRRNRPLCHLSLISPQIEMQKYILFC